MNEEISVWDKTIVSKYKQYYDKVNVNGNYCDRISQLNACIKKLTEELEDSRKYQAIQNDDIARLKELLKECKEIIDWYKADSGYVDLPTENILKQIEMLQNPENVAENVVNTESQH